MALVLLLLPLWIWRNDTLRGGRSTIKSWSRPWPRSAPLQSSHLLFFPELPRFPGPPSEPSPSTCLGQGALDTDIVGPGVSTAGVYGKLNELAYVYGAALVCIDPRKQRRALRFVVFFLYLQRIDDYLSTLLSRMHR